MHISPRLTSCERGVNQTSEHLELRRHLPMLLQCLDGLSQQGRVGRGKRKSGGISWCVVENELGESVQQEDGGTSSHQCCSAQGVARVGLQPYAQER